MFGRFFKARRESQLETANINPLAPEHLPGYIVAADGSDFLFTYMAFFTVGLVLMIGVFYLTLHAMPERMAHESNHSQMQVVGILAVLALFTHNNIFWIIAILVAAFRMPDFMTPISSIAQSLASMAGRMAVPAGPVQPVEFSEDAPDLADHTVDKNGEH